MAQNAGIVADPQAGGRPAVVMTTMARPAIDTWAVKQRTDLLGLIGADTRLKKVASTADREYAGPGPFCGGRDRFQVQPAKGRW